MKKLIVCSLFAAAALAGRAAGENVLTAKNVEVVVLTNAAPTPAYAAEELAKFLGESLGGKVPVVNVPTKGRVSIIVGTNAWSQAAGVDVSTLAQDGSFLVSKPGRVYLLGRNSPQSNLRASIEQGWWSAEYESGDYYAVIGFLERYVGCRFYFPGELGTCVPKAKRVVVPYGTIKDEPDFQTRYWRYWFMGEWIEPLPTDKAKRNQAWGRIRNASRARLRTDTAHIPVSHGQSRLSLGDRFRETHPEYFALTEKGERLWGSKSDRGFDTTHLCFTSGVWEEIYKDAVSFFKHEDASVRKVVKRDGPGYEWPQLDRVARNYFDVMPQDNLYRCRCPNCEKAYAGKGDDWARDIVWENTVKIANRVKAAGLKGTITQMCYGQYYDFPPDLEIPDNVAVMLAASGPWSMGNPRQNAAQLAEIKEKLPRLHGKLWLWNYAGKFSCFRLDIPNVPQMTPRAIVNYYKQLKGQVFGAYLETETDRFLCDHLNYYAFAHVAWDLDTDADQLLEEYARLMFGPAAKEMARIIDIYEDKWINHISVRILDCAIGPMAIPPSTHDLWTKVYSPAVLDELDALYDAAERKTKPGSIEAKRVALFRRELYAFRKTARDYQEMVDVDKGLAWNKAHPNASVITEQDIRNRGNVPFDTKVFKTAPSSVRMDDTFKVFTLSLKSLRTAVKENTRYRFSYLVKTEGKDCCLSTLVRTKKGADGLFWAPSQRYPIRGTYDWLRQSVDVTTPSLQEFQDADPIIVFMNHSNTGTIWLDEIRLEELGPAR